MVAAACTLFNAHTGGELEVQGARFSHGSRGAHLIQVMLYHACAPFSRPWRKECFSIWLYLLMEKGIEMQDLDLDRWGKGYGDLREQEGN